MSKHIVEETPAKGSHAQGDNPVEKQASQLAYDVKYKVKQQLNKGTKMNPAQVAKAYLAQLAKSPAPPAVKALAKKKLIGEEYTSDVASLAEKAMVNAMVKVFVEGIEEKVEEVQEEVKDKQYKIRVTDKKTGNTYVRMASRAKIAELRANPNISSVEMTGYGAISGDEKSKGKQTAAAKAGKDYDGDGKVESGAKEYRGAVHNAIQRKKGGKADGQDTSSVKEEVIYEKEGDIPEKKITGKGVNNKKRIKVFPSSVTEQAPVADKVDPAQKRREQQNDRARQQEVQILQKKLQALRSSPKGSDPSIMASYEAEGEVVDEAITSEKGKAKMKAMLDARTTASGRAKPGQGANVATIKHIGRSNRDGLLGTPPNRKVAGRNWPKSYTGSGGTGNKARRRAGTYQEEVGVVRYCPKCDKDETREECKYGGEYWDENSKPAKGEDERENPTKMDLFKNKLRARGIKVAGITPAPRNMKTGDELGESAEDRARDEHQMRGGMAARVDYDRPPAKKLSNKELGIKPLTPEQKAKRMEQMRAHLKKMK